MLIHVGHLVAVLGPYLSHVEVTLSQERRVRFKPYNLAQRNACFFGMSGPGWANMDVYGASVGPMLIHVMPLEATLGPYSGHVGFGLNQRRRVPFNNTILKVLRAGNLLR